MALDWETAEINTRGLSRDKTSRLSTLPRDVVNSIAPYLHTYTHDGRPYRDGEPHGTQVYTHPEYYGVCEIHNGKRHGVSKWWHADGSMDIYIEYIMGRQTFSVYWGDRISVYDDGRWTQHDTIPDKYRWVWASMTHAI